MEELVVDPCGARHDLNVHSSDEQLELYTLGRLSASEVTPLEEHLIVCGACREKLEMIGDFALGMRSAGQPQAAQPLPSASPSRWSLFLRHPAISTGLAFVSVLVVIAIFSATRNHLAPSASLQLTATRGGMPLTVPAHSLDLRLTDAPAKGGPFRIEIFNASGESVWRGSAPLGPAGIEVNVRQSLPQGDYFVRLYSAAGQMLREYGFRIRG